MQWAALVAHSIIDIYIKIFLHKHAPQQKLSSEHGHFKCKLIANKAPAVPASRLFWSLSSHCFVFFFFFFPG